MKRIIDIYLHWDQQTWTTRIIATVPVLVLVFGWMYYDKTSERGEMHTNMVAMCEGDQSCLAAVNQHADMCFDDHYRMGRHSHGVRMDEFVQCVNEKSGTQFFRSVKAE